MTGRFTGGRDRARIPGADTRTERSARIKGIEQNLGEGVEYDPTGRLRVSQLVLDRIAALEVQAQAPPAPILRVRDDTAGAVDGVLEAIPDVGAAYDQTEQRAVNAALRNNLAELQAEVDRLSKILRERKVVR